MLKKKLLIAICAIISGTTQLTAQTTTNKEVINEEWLFYKESNTTDNKQFTNTSYNDAAWEQVNLPHTPKIEPYLVNDQWQGTCWYRKHIDIDKETLGKIVLLRLGAAMNESDIWLNGKHIKNHLGGYLPVVVDLTSNLKEGDNIIVVKLDNRDNAITGPKPLKILDFNTYGGIYRNAEIIVKNRVYITDPILENKVAGGGVFVTYPTISKSEATVEVKTHIRNSSATTQKIRVENRFREHNGKKVFAKDCSDYIEVKPGQDIVVTSDIAISNPRLWSPSTPELYRLETILYDGEEILDIESNTIGIREIKFKDNLLYINGEKTFLRGVNRHQEYPYVGYAIGDNANWRDAVKIKQSGFDYIRLSHYPASESFMEACNTLGILVLDAILGWQFTSEDPAFQEQILSTVRDMIRRDRNHPCVLAWEVSLNESRMSDKFVKDLNRVAREEFPNAVTAGWVNHDSYDIYLQARQHRNLTTPEKYTKPLSVSEYGDWEYYAKNAGFNQDSWGNLKEEERTSRQLREYGEAAMIQQALNLQESHNDNQSLPAFGDGYWVMYDYNRGYSKDLEASGIMSIDRLPKFSKYFYESQRSVGNNNGFEAMEPMAMIASYWMDKETESLKVFSNCEEIELYINGEKIGRQSADTDNNCTHLSHPPFTFKDIDYQAGRVEAIGYIDNKKVCTTTIRTPEIACQIDMTIDESEIGISANDLFFVYVAIKDRNNTTIPQNGGLVNFTIEGDGTIVGDAIIDFKAGIAFALVRTASDAGSVKITATTDIAGETLKTSSTVKF